jgi:hypothetical protein
MQKFFDKDWLKFEIGKDPVKDTKTSLVWRLKDNVRTPPGIGLSHMVDGIRRMKLGTSPYVSLSGGVDSQAVCLLLKEAGINFIPVILEFKDRYNSMDTDCAYAFCEKHGIKYETIELDVFQFLSRSLPEYADKYKCPSPQFNTHFKFYEMLIDKHNPSSILAGGNAPFFYNEKLTFNTTVAQNSWTNFVVVNDYPLFGNVLGWSLDIAASLIVATPNVTADDELKTERYETKVLGMHRLGLDVTPQDQKYNGFEVFKQHLARMTGDGWSFEKSFRYPFEAKFPNYTGVLAPSKLEKILLRMNKAYK